jgi:hypothetical protein
MSTPIENPKIRSSKAQSCRDAKKEYNVLSDEMASLSSKWGAV